MPRFKISSKVLIYFLLVAILPSGMSTYILVSRANIQLLNAASAQQQVVASDLEYRVNNYLTNKINNLVHISQLYSTNQLSSTDLSEELAVVLNGDPDMQRVALVNSAGQDQLVFNRAGQDSTLANEASSDAFKVVSYKGIDYVGYVSYDAQHNPIVTIAAPVLASTYSQHLNNLKSASFGTANSSVDGAVIASYNMSNLWKSVLSTKVGKGGYAYVVDGFGNLVAYPKHSFLTTHPKLTNVGAVKNFRNGDFDTTKTVSETGQPVISTPRTVPASGSDWGVIVEEPVNNIYSDVDAFAKLATIIGLTSLAISIGLSLYFRKQLIGPIRKLTVGAKRFGEGNFNDRITVNTKDELHELAETFNSMGASINKLIGDLQANNIDLKLEQSKLNNIIASVSDGVIALDNKGIIVSANPPAAKLIGKKVEEVEGKPMSEVYPLESDDKPFKVGLKELGIYPYNDLVLPRNDSMAYLNIVVSVISHKDNDIAAIITINDLTQSRELDFMKLDFVAIAAHELRTPLTVVRGYLDIINTEAIKKLTLSGLESLQKALQGTDQLKDLINKLLNIARIERGEMEISIEKLNLTKVVKDNARQHESAAMLKEQTVLFTSGSEKNIFVPADPASVTEVLNNLIGNAIKYTSRSGKIEVRLSQVGNEARVEVIDDGPGVPPELRAKLFTKFYRAERSLIAGTRGTGLGLFISKTIIELQHGTIGLADTPKGSTFYFTLPIYDPHKHDKLVTADKPIGGINGWFKKRDAGRRRSSS